MLGFVERAKDFIEAIIEPNASHFLTVLVDTNGNRLQGLIGERCFIPCRFILAKEPMLAAVKITGLLE